MKRLVLVPVVILLLGVGLVHGNNVLTERRVSRRGIDLHATASRLVGKPQGDVEAYLTAQGFRYHLSDDPGGRSPHYRIVGESEKVGRTLEPGTGHRVWHMAIVFTFDKATKTAVNYEVGLHPEPGATATAGVP